MNVRSVILWNSVSFNLVVSSKRVVYCVSVMTKTLLLSFRYCTEDDSVFLLKNLRGEGNGRKAVRIVLTDLLTNILNFYVNIKRMDESLL